MLSQTTEVRCPADGKLLLGLSEDFAGAVSTRCGRCKADVGHPDLDVVPVIQLRCSCGRWLATGSIEAGSCRAPCKRCHVLVALTPSGPRYLEPPRDPRRPSRGPRPARYPSGRIVGLIEERWHLLRMDRAHRSVDIAVGVRFDVLNRDGFRCRYCGRGPSEGVMLEVDHVVPRSAGGTDTLDNLVAACWDCNRGKSDKAILAS